MPEVDVAGGRIVIDPPGGLFESADDEDLGRATSRPGDADLMRIDVVTIFPDYLAPLTLSLIGKAREQGLLDVVVHDLRDFTHDRHRTVDDTPYGGGAGLVMRPEPWGEALDAVAGASGDGRRPRRPATSCRCCSCRRRPASGSARRMARELAAEPWLVFACGRYEGIDERVLVDAARRFRSCRSASATTCSAAARSPR